MANLAKLKQITNDLNSFTQNFARELEYETLLLESGGQTPIFNFLKQVFDNIKSAIFIVSKECTIIYANPIAVKYAKQFGGSAVLGDYCVKFWTGKKLKCNKLKCPIRKAMKAKKMLIDNIDFRGIRYEMVVIPLYDNGTTSALVISNIKE